MVPSSKKVIKVVCFVYLLLVPVAVTALAFIVGHVSYSVYIPFWVLNALLMFAAARTLGTVPASPMQRLSWFFIIPWMLIAVFGGMGPPPETAAGWAALASEQIARYTILIAAGILVATGFFKLKRVITHAGDKRYAFFGAILIGVALPLFILNMAYWGFFLTHVFKTYSMPSAGAKPAWLKDVSDVFTVIRMAEVSLIYLGTAAFARALAITGTFNRLACSFYIVFSFLGCLLNLLPGTVPQPLATANYLSYIPAFTLLMPYLIGVNLVRGSR